MEEKDNNKVIKAYKGFNKDMTCRDFKYEVGKEYETDGAILCEKGFHACENPLDVLGYYFMDGKAGMMRFCEVEQSGKISRNTEGKDTKLASTKIKIKAEIKFSDLVRLGVEWLKEKTFGKDDRNDGDYAQIGSSGYFAKIGSSGDFAKIGSSGESAKINSEGEDSVICCAGHNSVVKAKKGSWITLSEWKYDSKKNRYVPVCVKTAQVDGERIKEDVYYTLVDGEFVEVK